MLLAVNLLSETEKFPGNISFMTMSVQKRFSKFVSEITDMVERTGNEFTALKTKDSNTLPGTAVEAGEWFQTKMCLFLIDDIWCVNAIPQVPVE